MIYLISVNLSKFVHRFTTHLGSIIARSIRLHHFLLSLEAVWSEIPAFFYYRTYPSSPCIFVSHCGYLSRLFIQTQGIMKNPGVFGTMVTFGGIQEGAKNHSHWQKNEGSGWKNVKAWNEIPFSFRAQLPDLKRIIFLDLGTLSIFNPVLWGFCRLDLRCQCGNQIRELFSIQKNDV